MSALIAIISVHVFVVAAFGALCSAWINRKALKNIGDWIVSILLTTAGTTLAVMKASAVYKLDDLGSDILALVVGFLGWGIALQTHKFVFGGELKKMALSVLRARLNIGGSDDK